MASNKSAKMQRHIIDPTRVGWACGIIWALGVGGMGLLSMALPGYGAAFINVISSVYLGYSATAVGTAIGTVLALIDGFVAGYILAWIYNQF